MTRTVEDMEAEIAFLKEELEEARSSAAAFYFVMDCPDCDKEIYEGVNLTTLEHRGRPAIPFDMASQTNFRCDHCGASNYTGDFADVVFTESDGNHSDDDDDQLA